MNKKQGSGSGLFLMEMIMVVGFFILCAGICISVFVRANQLSRRAQDTNQSVIMAQSVMEVWKAEGGEGLARQFGAEPLEDADGKGYLCQWDAGWNPVGGGQDAAFYGRCYLTWEDGVSSLQVMVGRGPWQGETQPWQGETQPRQGETEPQQGETQPWQGETQPQQGETEPQQVKNQPLYQLTGSRYEPGGDMD